jgi:hypothetical protein
MIIVALISGAVSLTAAAIAVWSSRSVAQLNSRLEEQRHMASKREQAEELRARYRDPLLGAVFDLQSRLYNVVAQGFLVRYARGDEGSREYAIENTLYVLAQYLAWVEIIRREIQFLDLGEEVADREWLNALEGVRDALARDDLDPLLRVFRGEQRAIGEVTTVQIDGPDGSQRRQSMGYAQFVDQRRTPSFARWFGRLQGDVEALAAEPAARLERVWLLQNRLVDVLEIFDPAGRRFPAELRTRLSLPGQREPTA